MNNYNYAEGFSTSSKKSNFHGTPLLGSSSEEPTQVFHCPSEEPTYVMTTPDVTTTITTATATASATASASKGTKRTQDVESDDDYSAFTTPPSTPRRPTKISKKTKKKKKVVKVPDVTVSSQEPTEVVTFSDAITTIATTSEKSHDGLSKWLTDTVPPSPCLKQKKLPKRETQTSMSMYVTPLKKCNKKIKSMKSTNKFVSRRHGYGVQWRDAMPGDLVMAFASDIDHPAVVAGAIHRSYILVGIVNSFVDVEWDTKISDIGITVQERLNVLWGNIDNWNNYSPDIADSPRNDQVKVIALKMDGDVDKLNPQFKAMIDEQFTFGLSGWQFKQY